MKSDQNNNLSPFAEWYEWIKYGHSLIRDSSNTQNEIAKYVIGLISGVIAIYTTLLTFFGLQQNTSLNLIIVLPLIFIISSLGVTLLVFRPQKKEITFDDPVNIMKTIAERSRIKYRFLSAGIILFIIGIVTIPFVIGIGSIPTEQNIQLIVIEDKQPLLEIIPISFENGTNKTVPLKLVREDDTKVVVVLENGNIAELSKDWIEVMVFTKS